MSRDDSNNDDGGAVQPRRLTARERRQRDAELGVHKLPGEIVTATCFEREVPLLIACDPASVFMSRERRDDDGHLHVRARLTPTGGGQVRVGALVAVTRDAEGNPTDFDDRTIGLASTNPIDVAVELGSLDVRALQEAHSIELLVEIERDIQELFLSAATGPYSTAAGRQAWPLTVEDPPPPHPPIRATLTCFTRLRDAAARVDFVLGVVPVFDWTNSLGLEFEFRLVDEAGRPLARESRGSGSLQPNRARVMRGRIYDFPVAQLELVRGVEIDVKTKITRWESLGVFVVDSAADAPGSRRAAAPMALVLERARARDQLTIGEAHALLREAGVAILESELAALVGEDQLENPTPMRQAVADLDAEARVLLDVVLDRISIARSE
jgi:hypothetical protein